MEIHPAFMDWKTIPLKCNTTPNNLQIQYIHYKFPKTFITEIAKTIKIHMKLKKLCPKHF